MASGKKGKKTKGKTIALTEFLQETPGALPTQPIRKSTTNWADEVEDYDALDSKSINLVLPTAPKASRDFDDIDSKVPKEPPFMAYLTNLPYDVDENDIADFFRNLKISNMRIPRDDRSGETRLKGFGYVEFEDRESLMSALIIPDTTLKSRRIRIEVAANAENDRRRGGRMGDRTGGDTGGDWRSTNRPEPIEDRRGGGFGRDRDGGGFGRDRDGGGFNRDREGGGGITREGMRESGSRDYGGSGFNRDREGGFNRDRDFGRDRDFNRDGRSRDQDDRPGAWRDGDRPNNNFNDRDRDRGFSRGFRDSDRNSRYDSDRDERRGGGGFRRYDDHERNGGITRNSNRGDRDDKESDAPSSEPRQRPKLNLAPRTKPLDQSDAKPEPAVPSASIFGSAKPVDTAERERQIEEKLLREQEEKMTASTESSRDRDVREDGPDTTRSYDRGRAPTRRDDRESSYRDTETNNSDRGPPSRERRNISGDDNRRAPRNENRSPDSKKKIEKEKPKREEKRDRSEKELPKLQEPEAPNFQGSNKFALLDEGDDD